MKQIYGIDLANEKFDVNYSDSKGKEYHKIVKNNYSSICRFLDLLPKEVILCAEYTGVYGELLTFLANTSNITLCLIPGYEIKHSLGLIKGKSDKIDSARIREYGERFTDRLKPVKLCSESMTELKELHSLRAQLVKERKMILCHSETKKHKPFNSVFAKNITKRSIEHLKHSIESIEDEILTIIQSDNELLENFDLVSSIKGVGHVTTCELIIKTENFTKLKTARKAASFAGVCPFPNSTGKMVGRRKTNKMSDKNLRSLLHLCGRSAVLYNKEFKHYFENKKREGKHYYIIMNNVSNKLLRVVYSIIESRIPYDPNYICIDPRNLKEKVA
jgi:transposase